MQYRRLGSSGLKLSAFSYGSWVTFGTQVDTRLATELLACAWDHGVNFFDNAEVYSYGVAERVMGAALAALKLPRDGYCVSSKVYFGSVPDPLPTQHGLSRKHIVEACDQALTRLDLDHLDLYYCHRPDEDTPVEEIVVTMDGLIRCGKVLYWGTSEWPAELIRAACVFAHQAHLIGPQMEQPQYNLLHRARVEQEYALLYEEYGIGATIWSPLASGLLTGKYDHGVPKGSRLDQPGYEWLRKDLLESESSNRKLEQVRKLTAIAHELDIPSVQFALAWCLRNPHVSTVILGASSREQLEQNLAALEYVDRIDDAVQKRIEVALQ